MLLSLFYPNRPNCRNTPVTGNRMYKIIISRFGPDLVKYLNTGRHGNRLARSIDRGRAVCTAVFARNPTSAWVNLYSTPIQGSPAKSQVQGNRIVPGTAFRHKHIVNTSISVDGRHIFIFRDDAIKIPVEQKPGERKGSHPSKVLAEVLSKSCSSQAANSQAQVIVSSVHSISTRSKYNSTHPPPLVLKLIIYKLVIKM
jgi:hypothetical protein